MIFRNRGKWVIKPSFQAVGEQSVDNGKLNRYNKETIKTNLQFKHKIV